MGECKQHVWVGSAYEGSCCLNCGVWYEDYAKTRIAELEAQRNTFRNLAKLVEKKNTALFDGLRKIKHIAKCRPIDREIFKVVNALITKEKGSE